jgi:hypothetical protein
MKIPHVLLNLKKEIYKFGNLMKQYANENSYGLCTSQIYMLHEFVPNPCKIYYLIGSYCLNTNVIHYLNTKIVCTTFVCKQHEYTYTIQIGIWHLWLNNVHDINVQIIQINEWQTNLWKADFAWLLLSNHGLCSLWLIWAMILQKCNIVHLSIHVLIKNKHIESL